MLRANASASGLAAYFYTADQERVWRMMEALEYGIVGVNTGAVSNEVGPFGGIKESGVGREGSKYGIEEFLNSSTSASPANRCTRSPDHQELRHAHSTAARSARRGRIRLRHRRIRRGLHPGQPPERGWLHRLCPEAGPPDRSPYLHIPAGFIKAVFNPKYAWQFSSAGSAQTHGRRIPIPQGARWAARPPSTVWSTTAARPPTSTTGRRWAISAGPMKRCCPTSSPWNDATAATIYRGRHGELPVTDIDWIHPLCEAFMTGAVEQGIPAIPTTTARNRPAWAIFSAPLNAAGA